MADPVEVAMDTEDVWKIVATNVQTCLVSIDKSGNHEYLVTYNATGTGLPANDVAAKKLMDFISYNHSAAIDVYVKTRNGLGRVTVEA